MIKPSLALSWMCFGLAINSVHAECLGKDPVISAKNFYRNHENFSLITPATIKPIISSRLFNALEKEFACSQRELCAIEVNPWTDAQDGDIREPIAFKFIHSSNSRAKVKIHYTLAIDSERHRKQSAALMLHRQTASGCWVIADLVGPKGISLLATIEKWHQENGRGL